MNRKEADFRLGRSLAAGWNVSLRLVSTGLVRLSLNNLGNR